MADQRLTDKTALTVVAQDDLVHVVDVSDTTANAEGTSKKVTIANLKTAVAGSGVQSVKVSLSAAQINNIGTTPVLAIPAQGAGTLIQIISAIGKANSNTSPFDGTINLKYSGRAVAALIFPNSLKTTNLDIIVTGVYFGVLENGANEDLSISGTDSTIVGDGTIDIYITYEIITL